MPDPKPDRLEQIAAVATAPRTDQREIVAPLFVSDFVSIAPAVDRFFGLDGEDAESTAGG